MIPQFPYFKPIQIDDAPVFNEKITEYKPETSEWTFTNLFAWRDYYHFEWSVYLGWLMIVGCRDGLWFAMQPIGPGSRSEVVRVFFEWLKSEKKTMNPFMERTDTRLVAEIEGMAHIKIIPLREHFDYLYLRDDLINLTGSKYRTKRNRINNMTRSFQVEFSLLDENRVHDCLLLQEKWCLMHRCDEDLSLLGEWQAIREMLINFEKLSLVGGVITINEKTEAFTIGEPLNDNTTVVHIEKANPEIPALYTVINQQANEKCWKNSLYINREQDLGLPGLRKAKLSYNPARLVEKYRIASV